MPRGIVFSSIISKSKLESLYSGQKLSINKIARLTGFGREVIRKYLIRWEIPRRTRKEYTPTLENHYHWKGGFTKERGYIHRRIFPDNPFYSMVNNSWGYVAEHRFVMAQHLGRCLKATEIVHHLNGIRIDNRLCNLGLVTRNNHSHHTLQKQLQARLRDLEAELSQQKLSF